MPKRPKLPAERPEPRAPIVFGGVLYLDRSDEAAFRSRLRLESLQRPAGLAWQANVDRAEGTGKESDPGA
jgi:hypothetical protein